MLPTIWEPGMHRADDDWRARPAAGTRFIPSWPPRLPAGSPWWAAWPPGAGFILGAAPARCRAHSSAMIAKSFWRGAGL